MTWSITPHVVGSNFVMQASLATDAASPPVEYNFECRSGSGTSSGWQSSRDYSVAITGYAVYRVRARDALHNMTGYSTSWGTDGYPVA
jgi:hypothetical protein